MMVPSWMASCYRQESRLVPPRLVVLYATCSLHAGHLGSYGRSPSVTPALDRFAARSAVFDRHITESGQSGIAYASIFSGLHADGHGIYDHPRVLSSDVELITEAFAAAGWEIYFWGGHGMASYALGYGQGVPEAGARKRLLTADDALFVDLLQRLEKKPETRALVVTNFTVTHMKYTQNEAYFTPRLRNAETLPGAFADTGLAPDELESYRELMFNEVSNFELCGDPRGTLTRLGFDDAERRRFITAMDYLYKCAVNRLDGLFGSVVAAVDGAGLADSSVIAFTSDHGELLWRDNAYFAFAHGWQLAPEVLRVPLIVRASGLGLAAGRRGWVSRSIDVFPTLAGLAGVAAGDGPKGLDLSSALLGRSKAPAIDAFSHTALVPESIVNHPDYDHSTLKKLFPDRRPESIWVSLRRDDMHFKLQRSAPGQPIRPAAFDLRVDPGETRNLFDTRRPSHADAVSALHAYKDRLVTSYRPPADEGLTEADRVEQLRALGYL
jgi:arylsulfatase A-like enzyme